MSEILGDWKRSHYCGDLRKQDIGRKVCLMGWVHRRRDHGGLIFIDLRDRTGIAQLALDPDRDPQSHAKAEAIRNEFVVAAIGTVSPRPEGTVNPKMKTGEVEIEVSELRILNVAKTPPFMLDEYTEVAENLRLKYRYLDLRRDSIQQNIMMRHQVAQTTPQISLGSWFSGNRDADVDQEYSGRCSRLPGTQPCQPGQFLRIATIAADFQAAPDGLRL